MKRFLLAAVALAVSILIIWCANCMGRSRQIQSYLANSVIVGDSIATGYQNYCIKSGEESLQSIRFLTAVSFSAHNALCPVSEKSVHPLYQGEQRPVWESIAMTGAENVFLFLGMNDLNSEGDTCDYYKELVEQIQKWMPEARIHVISVTYTNKGVENERIRNDNIDKLNISLRELAIENKWGFVDLTTPLSDGEGNLAEEYCSDAYVHQTKEAYQVWTEVLCRYIDRQIDHQKYDGKGGALYVEVYGGAGE